VPLISFIGASLDHSRAPKAPALDRTALTRFNVAVEVARRVIISTNPKKRKSPTATAGLFDFRKQPTHIFRKKCDRNTPELFSGQRPG
jgi:hypothetical protein